MSLSHLVSRSIRAVSSPRRRPHPFGAPSEHFTDEKPITVETSLPFTAHNCEPPSRTVETTRPSLSDSSKTWR
ncbi:unnamed protein product [Rhodiola kirilowii]